MVVTRGPIVARTTTMLRHEDVLRIVELRVGRVDDALDDTRLQIEQDRARNVMVVVSLVEEDVLSVRAFACKVLESAVFRKHTWFK